jgi:hypothetical protein
MSDVLARIKYEPRHELRAAIEAKGTKSKTSIKHSWEISMLIKLAG